MRGDKALGLSAVLVVAGCVTTGGGSSGPVSGSASENSSQGTVELTRCPAPLSTAAIAVPKSFNQAILVQYELPPDPTPAMRLIAQQSGCFQIVHRDVVLQNIKAERELAQSGELKDAQAFEKGQLVGANYTLLVEVLLSNPDSGGVGGAFAQVGGMFGLLGVIAGNIKFKEAQVLLTMVDNRTGLQKATASGKASGTSFGGFGAGIGMTSAAAAGGYMNTAQGKVVMGAMVDAMNNLIPQMGASVSAQ